MRIFKIASYVMLATFLIISMRVQYIMEVYIMNQRKKQGMDRLISNQIYNGPLCTNNAVVSNGAKDEYMIFCFMSDEEKKELVKKAL